MGAISTSTTSVTSHSVPGLLFTPSSCAAALNKTLSNKCIFSQPSSGFCESQLYPKGKKTKQNPKPQTSENTKILKPKQDVFSSAAACRQRWQQHTLIPTGAIILHITQLMCTVLLLMSISSPLTFLRQLLPKSSVWRLSTPTSSCDSLQDLSSDFLGSTAQQSANFPVSLIRIIYITS